MLLIIAMPLIEHTNLNQNTILAIWKITESHEQLLAMLSGAVEDKGINLHSNIHWIASRLLLQQVFSGQHIELHKDEHNKPSLFMNHQPYSISITHSYEYAAIMVSNTQVVAVDLERIDDRVLRVARKFIRPDEVIQDADQVIYYTLIWSAKETLYKYYSKKELDFLKHLHILPFTLNQSLFTIEGKINKEAFELVLPIHIRFIQNYVLTYSFGN